MNQTSYSESQILAILKEAQGGTPVPELCREHGMSNSTFYKWWSKYGGMDVSLLQRMKELKAENKRLKKMYAKSQLKTDIIQEGMRKKW